MDIHIPFTKRKEVTIPLAPDNVQKKGVTILSSYEAMASYPSVTFADQVEAFECIPELRESVLHSCMEVLGDGFNPIVVDKAYTVTLPRPVVTGKQWTADEALNLWCRENEMDENILTIILELIAYGNSFWLITDNGLQSINIEQVLGVEQYEKNTPKSVKYNLKLNSQSKPSVIKWGEFIHFRINVTSSSKPLGSGVIAGMLEHWGTNDSLIDATLEMRQILLDGFGMFSQPTQVYQYPEADDEAIKTKSLEIKKLPKYGGRFATNEQLNIISPTPNKERGYDQFVPMLFDVYIMSFGDPSLKASVESGFTEASIKGSIDLYRKKIQYIRRTVKRLMEKLLRKILTEYGFDADTANPKIDFGSEQVEWTLADLDKAFTNKVIDVEEYRTMLRKKAKWELKVTNPKVEGVSEQ